MSTTAVEQRRANPPATLKQILSGDAFKGAVAKALPKHLPADRFLRVAQTAMTKTPKLAECDQASFLGALLSLSALGLEPDGRRAHLIPFENRRRGCVECQLIIDYKGIVELAMRSGTVASIHADKVCENDTFEVNRGSIIKHTIDYRRPRGEAYAYYCLITFKDGGEKSEVMTRDEIEAVRGRSRAGNSGPWVTDFDEMSKKTVFKRASKWITLSPEIMDAFEAEDEQKEQPIQVFTRVEAGNFALPESQPEQLPAPSSPPVDDGDLGPAKEKATEQPTEGPSIKDQLAAIVISAGYTFDDFKKWGTESGNIPEQQADVMAGFDEVPQALAKRLVNAKTGMLKGLSMLKAVAA